MKPHEMNATDAAKLLRQGGISAEAIVVDCLDRIDRQEPEVQAWIHLDPEHAVAQAKAADARQRAGEQLGPLHGVPVAIKDIFDTCDYPTEWGSSLLAGRRPDEDSAVVERLRGAGAIILGKTVTTEFASFAPGPTCNPHDLSRTPGGSSSGSAAAVAARMVPLALGSQTAGSTIRPGSFCGIVALKPQFGAISRHGCMTLSGSLDHVGLYARTVGDIALLAGTLYGEDPRDPASGSVNSKELSVAVKTDAGIKPRLGFVPTPFWDRMDKASRQAFEGFVDGLGDIERVELPAEFSGAPDFLNTICDAEVAHGFAELYREGADQFSVEFRAEFERGCQTLAAAYLEALEAKDELSLMLDEILGDYDALLTPAALGEATVGLESTGDPIFCSTWTLTGHPAMSLPLLKGAHDLPVGVQLVGRRGEDGGLLRTASTLY